MKEFITGIAAMLLITVFLSQFTANQIIHNKLIFAENDINTFIEEIKFDGCVSFEENSPANELKSSLMKDLKLSSDAEIVITGTETPVKRGELIEYSVSYPLENIIGASGLLGITGNKVMRERSGKTASELIIWE